MCIRLQYMWEGLPSLKVISYCLSEFFLILETYEIKNAVIMHLSFMGWFYDTGVIHCEGKRRQL